MVLGCTKRPQGWLEHPLLIACRGHVWLKEAGDVWINWSHPRMLCMGHCSSCYHLHSLLLLLSEGLRQTLKLGRVLLQ